MKKVLTTIKLHNDAVSMISKIAKLYQVSPNHEEIVKNIGDADAIIGGSGIIDKEVLDAAKKLKMVAKHGIGVDNIDIEAASERNIYITNAKSGPSCGCRRVCFRSYYFIS